MEFAAKELSIDTLDQPQTWPAAVASIADELQQEWIAVRRHLHQHPELSDQEYATTEYLASLMRHLELPFHVVGDGRGVVSDLVTSPALADGPSIAIRGDIDALPINDTKPVTYRSQCEGVMHACGHDVHATVIYGAMQILRLMEQRRLLPWPVSVRAIFQPSEEVASGSRYMIHHHAIRDIDTILALHVDPTRSVGCIGLRTGTLTAAADMVVVDFHGQGGHGARPHLTDDPIDACTAWIQTAYRRVSRTANPHETVVFSIGQIEAGHSANVIPDSAHLSGTLRSLDNESRRVALETLEDVCEAVQRETGCKVDMRLGTSAPGVINDPDVVQLLTESIVQMLSAGAVEIIDEPSMGSEDFSCYLEHIPGAMLRLGIAGPQVGSAPLHTSIFDIDERALAVGAKVFAAAVINYFRPDESSS